MPNFTFKGRNRQGETVAGERVAEDRGALAIALRREQIMLTDAAGKPIRRWDSRTQTFRHRYDPLQRPTHLFVQQATPDRPGDPHDPAERLLIRTVYGEALDGPPPDPPAPPAHLPPPAPGDPPPARGAPSPDTYASKCTPE